MNPNMKSLEYSSVASDEHDSEQQSKVRPRRWNARPRTIFLVVAAILALLLISGRIRKNQKHSNQELAYDPNHEWMDDDAKSSVENPDSPKQSPESSSISCGGAHFECKTDRLGHKSPLYAGQAICNKNYVVGLTRDGVFLWRDCEADEMNSTRIFFKGMADVYFEMQPNADFTIHDVSTKDVIWEERCTRTVRVTPKCLKDPALDCPYLHLHREGTLVLNYIDDNGKWNDVKVQRAYKNLFPDRRQ